MIHDRYLWKRPVANGDMAKMVAEAAPESSPKMVTALGSPPNLAMFFCTHFKAMI